MAEILKHLKMESTVAAITCIVVGVLFVIWPGGSILLLLRVLALILLVEGIICLVRLLRADEPAKRQAYVLPAAACLVVGLILLTMPGLILGIFPIIIGIFLLYHGIKGIASARAGSASTAGGTVGAVIMLLLGILLILRPFSAVKVLMVFVGIALIYDGIVMFQLTRGISDRVRQYRDDSDPEIIDADYTEEE